MEKKKVLLFTDWYYPGYKAGGPIQSCRNLVGELSDEFSFYIFTSDTDLGSENPYDDIVPNQWNKSSQGEMVFYAKRETITISLIKNITNELHPDAIYLNSMFSSRFTILPLLVLKMQSYKGKVILAPRGMLHRGALGLKSTKKKIFLKAFRLLRLQKSLHFHATDKHELTDICTFFPGVKIRIAENIPNLNLNTNIQLDKQVGELKLVFISRVHPTKNLTFLLKVFNEGNLKGKIQFDVFGSIDQPTYWEQCKAQLDKLPANVSFEYKGELTNVQVHETLTRYHAFVLPTLGENFGHAIFEALSSGLPVVISDRTPWKGLPAIQAGWDISLEDPDSFGRALQELADMDHETYRKWSVSARELAQNYTNQANFKQKYIELFA